MHSLLICAPRWPRRRNSGLSLLIAQKLVRKAYVAFELLYLGVLIGKALFQFGDPPFVFLENCRVRFGFGDFGFCEIVADNRDRCHGGESADDD